MKKQLLTVALVLTGICAFAPAAEAKSAMDAPLTMEWMNTDVAPLGNDARQGTAVGGKFYIQNKATQKIEIWDQTGKTGDIASGLGTNICRDEAGNIIVRIGKFPDAFSSANDEVKVIPANGSTPTTFPLKGVTGGRLDFWGQAAGDVMSDEGGYMYMGTMWQGFLCEVPVVKGLQNVADTYQYAFSNPIGISGTFPTTSISSARVVGEDVELAILTPYWLASAATTSACNSIIKMGLDDDLNWVKESYYITPRHNGATGFAIFTVGSVNYIIYSSGSNTADGFTIAKLATTDDYNVKADDENYRVATKYAETKDDGTVMYTNNAFYGNHFIVDVVDDNTAEIYQFFPTGYIAKYKFDTTKVGVEDVAAEADDAVIYGGTGEIVVENVEAAKVAVYTPAGALVSEGKANVSCPAGIYVVKAGKKTAKVIVK